MDIATYAYASNAYGLIASVTLNGTMLTRSRPTLVSPFGQPPAVYLRSHQSLRFTATNTWESYRAVLTEKKNKIGTTIVSEYDYIVNKDGQRTKVTMSGAVFTGTPWWGLAYNTTGEIEPAKHSATTAYNRAYDQDGLGNWDKSSEGATDPVSNPFTTGVVTDYTADSLNQYDSIKVGSAAAVSPVHDDDGNLTDDASIYTFEWNAENQLLKVRNRSTTALIATYTYDYLGRRVRKVTSSLDIVYVYDGWNLIAEYDNSGSDPALDRTYVWGLDLSVSIHGAGGVGGLLRVTDHTVSPIKHYYPFYDGNGNVSEYILNGATNAAIHFEYDAFGNVLNGPTGQDDPEFAIQFSTKLVDEETGLSYYGYRYYDPETGRWLSRDPLGEAGALNLFGLGGNDGVNQWDYFGLVDNNPNVYSFVGNDPLNDVDLFGLCGKEDVTQGWWSGTIFQLACGCNKAPTISATQPYGTQNASAILAHIKSQAFGKVKNSEKVKTGKKCDGGECVYWKYDFEYSVWDTYIIGVNLFGIKAQGDVRRKRYSGTREGKTEIICCPIT